MSGGLAPSRSTVYVSNLPFSLTNSDLHKIFEKYGRVVKVTILKDKLQRKSRGVAFVLYIDRDSAYKCVRAVNNTQMFGRTLKCSIAKDNGRTTEFIRRKEYKDKSQCYECGESGHLSFKCPKNLLGDREPPVKKKKKGFDNDENDEGDESDGNSGGEDIKSDSLAAAIQYEQQKIAESALNFNLASTSSSFTDSENQRKKYKKDSYFSDEEELD